MAALRTFPCLHASIPHGPRFSGLPPRQGILRTFLPPGRSVAADVRRRKICFGLINLLCAAWRDLGAQSQPFSEELPDTGARPLCPRGKLRNQIPEPMPDNL